MRIRQFVSLALITVSILAPVDARADFIVTPGTNTGAIPDGNANGRIVTFAVSGVGSPIINLSLQIGLTHPWAGDLKATLIAPGGVARLLVFGRVGGLRSNAEGDGSDFSGIYSFSDLGTPRLWQRAAEAAENAALPTAETYQPTSTGSPQLSSAGGCPTSFKGAFGGLTTAQANGNWQLVVSDLRGGSVGSVTSASLAIEAKSKVIFAHGFESGGAMAANPGNAALSGGVPYGALPHCINKVPVDFNGDGLSDYALVRNVGGALRWRIWPNTGNGAAGTQWPAFDFGTASTDYLDSMDVDGDRIADPVVWTPGTLGVARYRVRLSTRNGAERVVIFGKTGDDPAQGGDYDSDLLDDFAVYRAPPITGPDGPLQVVMLQSGSATTRTISIGTGTEFDRFLIAGFDYNGDGRADVVSQESDAVTPSSGRFRMYDGGSGSQFATFLFGSSTDVLVPGSFSGSALADVTVSRTTSGTRRYDTRDTGTGTAQAQVTFGIPGDTRVIGDYDGDLLQDHVVFRITGSNPSYTGEFLLRRSTDVANTLTVGTGPTGAPAVDPDFPVGNSRVR